MTFEEYAFARTSALVRLARLLTDDEHRAEDLVQEVLAQAYPRWGRITRTDRPDAYVRRMLVNTHNSWWPRRSSRKISVAAVLDRAGKVDEAAGVARARRTVAAGP